MLLLKNILRSKPTPNLQSESIPPDLSLNIRQLLIRHLLLNTKHPDLNMRLLNNIMRHPNPNTNLNLLTNLSLTNLNLINLLPNIRLLHKSTQNHQDMRNPSTKNPSTKR
jgi:hypothetical protein